MASRNGQSGRGGGATGRSKGVARSSSSSSSSRADARSRTGDRSASSKSRRGGTRRKGAGKRGGSRQRAARQEPVVAYPHNSVLELVTERHGVLGYRYRRFAVEQRGKVLRAREVSVMLDYDVQFQLETRLDRVVRVVSRRVEPEEYQALWTLFERMGREPERSRIDRLAFFPDTAAARVRASGDEEQGATDEGGPACLTVRWKQDRPRRGDAGDHDDLRRVVIDELRPVAPDEADEEPPAESALEAQAAALIQSMLVELPRARALNRRAGRAIEALVEEFRHLKAVHFLNLRQFERVALRIFGYFGDPAAIDVLGDELYAPNAPVRIEALRALRAIGDARDLQEDLRNLLFDDEEPVRREARTVLDSLRR